MRLGLLGGSFDPPHLGHLHVARVAHDELKLDRVRLIPAAQPPHKRGRVLAADAHRLAMLEQLAAFEPWLEIDARELRRGGTSFTHDTLREIRDEIAGPGVRLFFLLGSDSLVDLPTWHRAGELISLATIVTVPRDAGSVELGLAQVRAALPAAADAIRAHVLNAEPLPISSSQVRARVRAGQPIEELVPRAIADYIERHELYRDARGASG
jgi:nicotinate-nucleotide adenylyltransferase